MAGKVRVLRCEWFTWIQALNHPCSPRPHAKPTFGASGSVGRAQRACCHALLPFIAPLLTRFAAHHPPCSLTEHPRRPQPAQATTLARSSHPADQPAAQGRGRLVRLLGMWRLPQAAAGARPGRALASRLSGSLRLPRRSFTSSSSSASSTSTSAASSFPTPSPVTQWPRTDVPHLTNDLRAAFLDYFARHQHLVLPSSPTVPANDPSLLFTSAGMVQFKNVFLGLDPPPQGGHRRVATAQRCVRAGGKHNDLDNVGHTARHHTLFEMLGNFSFGDYFKEEAMVLAWRFLTQELRMPTERLRVSVFETDDDSARLWTKITGWKHGAFVRIIACISCLPLSRLF